MNHKIYAVLIACAVMGGGCIEQNHEDKASARRLPDYNSDDRMYSKPIPIDSANKMIQSYLTSIHPEINTFELKSLIFDANLLRTYLNDSSNGRVENLKMVVAHRMGYINSGHFGQRPDSNSEALTLVLVGYGQNGNYIYYNGNQVLNICQPCPRECPEVGTSANDLLPSSETAP